MQFHKFITFKKTIIFFILVSGDLLSKYFVYNFINLYEFIELTKFLDITHIHNFGVSFGLFSEILSSQILIIISLLVVVFIIYLFFNSKENLEKWGLFIIICGATGNIIDRFLNGYVIDFIYFNFNKLYWPAFNFADIYISIGIMMIIINMLKKIKLRKK